MTQELLPCPFCGDPMEWTGDFVRHVDYGAKCPIRGDGYTNAAAWNTRAGFATIPDPQAFMEAARGMREALADIDRLARDRIKDGDEMGQRCWLIGLVDIEREARTAIAAFDAAAQGEQ